jgi:hypothetical protein
MFTKADYANYFKEMEDIIKGTLVIYTDLLNELEDRSMHSKLYAIMSETADAFKFIKQEKEKFMLG